MVKFPDPRTATSEGLVAVGGNLKVETLLAAYRVGIFPWPVAENKPILWFSPEERGVLEFDHLRIPRSLVKERARSSLRFTIDQDFKGVINNCAGMVRDGVVDTWITQAMVNAYIEFHNQGYAHSVEAWEGDALVGGLYGVAVDGAFAGESMFSTQPGASKLALLYLIDYLKERGLGWIDIQTLSPLMSMLGGRTISRDEFLERLALTHEKNLMLFDGKGGGEI
jgi:leucyl/phenylalanyl-tRNA--protein transferase